jgi:hypothetical protein
MKIKTAGNIVSTHLGFIPQSANEAEEILDQYDRGH